MNCFFNKFTTWMCNSVNRMYTLTPGRWRNGKTMQSPTDLSNNWTTELHPLIPVLNIVLLILKLFWIISMFLKSKTINCNNLNETNIYTCVYKSEEKFKKNNSWRRTADLVRSLIIFNNKNTLLNLSVGSVAHFPLGTQIAVISSLGHVAFCLRFSG